MTASAKEIFPTLFDKAICINLKERDDRMENAQKEFDKVGLGQMVEFLRVDRHPRGGSYGCFDSHRRAVREAYESGAKSVVIFEDDVEFTEGWEEVVIETKEFMESGTPYDAFFLGSKIQWVDEKVFPRIWRVKCCFAHAYIVHRDGMKKFLDKNDFLEANIEGINHDVLQMSIWQSIYAHSLSEAICQDDALGTDNPGWFRHRIKAILPEEYVEWLQKTVGEKLASFFLPIVRKDWYIRSSYWRQYAFFLSKPVDDGRVVIHPWPYKGVEALVFVFYALVTPPPNGRVYTMTNVVLPIVQQRIRDRLGFEGKPIKNA